LRGAGRSPTIGSAALLLSLGLAAILLAGCGGARHAAPAASRLEREDLLTVAQALKQARGPVAREVSAAKAAWRTIANGLPRNAAAISRPAVQDAMNFAAKVGVPTPFQESEVGDLTGPANGLAALFRSYTRLSTRGWQQILAAIEASQHGTPAAAKFARANSALYIESIYDGHYSLASIGKRLLQGYEKLGGAAAFGASLTQQEVNALAQAYSESANRLHPHVGVRLGS
jgi:hypothetical protein